MAKNKVGLDYFSFDIDFFNDEKIEFVSARFGIKGEIIAIRLLCKIYRNGYYTEWNDDESILLAKRAGDGFSSTLVSEIVNELVKRGFFDKSLLNSFGILTSKGIQKRYISAISERKEVEIISNFWLINIPESTKKTTFFIKPPIIEEKPPIISQSKVKESKVKESKVNIVPNGTCPLTKIDFEKILEMYHSICVSFPVLRGGLSDERKRKIKLRMDEMQSYETLEEVFYKMQNSKFCRGEIKEWKANFDFVFENSKNWRKILEGNYDDKKQNDPLMRAVQNIYEVQKMRQENGITD